MNIIAERQYKLLYLRENIDEITKYEQLAEECCELAQAALKYIRASGKGNPTPISQEEALENVKEEIIDVELCLDVLGEELPSIKLFDEKLNRWFTRIIMQHNKIKEENQNDTSE